MDLLDYASIELTKPDTTTIEIELSRCLKYRLIISLALRCPRSRRVVSRLSPECEYQAFPYEAACKQ